MVFYSAHILSYVLWFHGFFYAFPDKDSGPQAEYHLSSITVSRTDSDTGLRNPQPVLYLL